MRGDGQEERGRGGKKEKTEQRDGEGKETEKGRGEAKRASPILRQEWRDEVEEGNSFCAEFRGKKQSQADVIKGAVIKKPSIGM